jgi:pescadillo protein
MSKIQTLFHEKDIRFLLHEPIVWKFRDFKVFLKKLKRAHDKGNLETADRLKQNKPKYNLDHIVKERYPTFVDAIRDLEDCLCLCFLYATFPRNPKTPIEMIELCKKLTVEFMHYVIESKALRKVFVSIKGYYYQAEIMGQTVTWVVPHSFAYEPPESVDLRLMSIFVEFYTTVFGFINFRLYHNLNLQYPPSLPHQLSSTAKAAELSHDELLSDRVAALNQSLAKTVANYQGGDEDEDAQLDDIPMADGSQDEDQMEVAKKAAEELRNLKTMFKGKRFFLSREVPRESLVFMVRAIGGEVSWDETAAPGSTFKESDEKITHQVCTLVQHGSMFT